MEKRGHKRTPAQRLGDLEFISKGLLAGRSHQLIAWQLSQERPYNLTRSQISKDAQKIYAEWREAYLHNVNSVKARELARLDLVESQAWEAWERSQQPQTETEEVEIDDNMDGRASYSRRKSTEKSTGRVGEVKYLQTIEGCIRARCRILGLESPKSVNINWRKQAAEAGVDPDQVVGELEEQFLAAARKGLDDKNPPPD